MKTNERERGQSCLEFSILVVGLFTLLGGGLFIALPAIVQWLEVVAPLY